MPCEVIIIRKSPSAKTRLKKPRFLRENEALPRRTFFDSKKTSKNTRMYLGEKSPFFEKPRENGFFRHGRLEESAKTSEPLPDADKNGHGGSAGARYTAS
jgi:hypothetical protein